MEHPASTVPITTNPVGFALSMDKNPKMAAIAAVWIVSEKNDCASFWSGPSQ